MTARFQGGSKERSMRNQLLMEKFKENMGSIAGQQELGEKLRRTASYKHIETGRNILFEGERDA